MVTCNYPTKNGDTELSIAKLEDIVSCHQLDILVFQKIRNATELNKIGLFLSRPDL